MTQFDGHEWKGKGCGPGMECFTSTVRPWVWAPAQWLWRQQKGNWGAKNREQNRSRGSNALSNLIWEWSSDNRYQSTPAKDALSLFTFPILLSRRSNIEEKAVIWAENSSVCHNFTQILATVQTFSFICFLGTWSHYVIQAGFKLSPPASTSQCVGLQTYTTRHCSQHALFVCVCLFALQYGDRTQS